MKKKYNLGFPLTSVKPFNIILFRSKNFVFEPTFHANDHERLHKMKPHVRSHIFLTFQRKWKAKKKWEKSFPRKINSCIPEYIWKEKKITFAVLFLWQWMGAISGDGYNNQSVTCVQQCEARFFFSVTLQPTAFQSQSF